MAPCNEPVSQLWVEPPGTPVPNLFLLVPGYLSQCDPKMLSPLSRLLAHSTPHYPAPNMLELGVLQLAAEKQQPAGGTVSELDAEHLALRGVDTHLSSADAVCLCAYSCMCAQFRS